MLWPNYVIGKQRLNYCMLWKKILRLKSFHFQNNYMSVRFSFIKPAQTRNGHH